jgi:hypothetical protein
VEFCYIHFFTNSIFNKSVYHLSLMNRQQLRTDFRKFQQRREMLWAPKINKALRQQVKYFIDVYGLNPPNTDHILIDPTPVYDVLHKLYIDAGVTWGAKTWSTLPKLPAPSVKARMPIGLSEFLIQAITDYFDIELLNDVQDITDTTRKVLIEALKKATAQGLGVDDTVKLMYATTPERARLIARTETVTAANKGAALAAEATGLVLQKTWIAATDNRTRPDHAEVNGTVIDFEEAFIVGGYPMQQPGDRGTQGNATPAKEVCNCRCTVGYQGKRDANGRLMRAK